MISAIRRLGVPYLLTILPDGQPVVDPGELNHWKAEPLAGTPSIAADDAVHDLGRLGDLLRLRELVDALSSRDAELAPCKEGRHAIEPGLFQSARCSAKSANSVEQIDEAARLAAVEDSPARLISRLLQDDLATEASGE